MLSKVNTLMVVALILCLLILVWRLVTRGSRRNAAQRDSIVSAGNKVWATVVSTHPTGQSSGNNSYRLYAEQYYVLLALTVPQADGTLAETTIKALPAPDWHALQPGDQVQVYQSSDDPTKLVLDTIMSPRYAETNKAG